MLTFFLSSFFFNANVFFYASDTEAGAGERFGGNQWLHE